MRKIRENTARIACEGLQRSECKVGCVLLDGTSCMQVSLIKNKSKILLVLKNFVTSLNNKQLPSSP